MKMENGKTGCIRASWLKGGRYLDLSYNFIIKWCLKLSNAISCNNKQD